MMNNEINESELLDLVECDRKIARTIIGCTNVDEQSKALDLVQNYKKAIRLNERKKLLANGADGEQSESSPLEGIVSTTDELVKVAVIDGIGRHATVDLYLECRCGEHLANLEWPEQWPEYVSVEFLREQGYKTIKA